MTRHPAQSQLRVRCAPRLRTMASCLVLLLPGVQCPVILEFCKHPLGVCNHPCIHVPRRRAAESSVWSAAKVLRASVEKDKEKGICQLSLKTECLNLSSHLLRGGLHEGGGSPYECLKPLQDKPARRRVRY